MAKLSAGRAVVEVLKAEGVKFVFGMPGGHTIGIYDALYGQQEITHVLVRHEQHAASMAAGYAQLTGEPGICCVTAGPGATNLVTSIAEAFVGALLIVIIAGRGATRNAHRGASQEIDQVRIFGPITKWAIRVDRPDLIVESLRQAFNVARSGKPGPVLVDIPQDVLASDIEFSNYKPVGKPARSCGDAVQIKAAAAALRSAKRPLIVSGGGAIASDAAGEVLRLAEALAIPVATTLAGRGILPDDHVLAAGGLGHHRQEITKRLLPNADVVLGIGTRFEQQETNWKPDYLPAPAATYIQIDVDPAEIGRSVVATIGIVGDAKLVLQDLLAELDQSCVASRWNDADTHTGGDGSFQMVMNILPVAAELKLGVTWCILNDGALGSIRDIQAQAFSERYIGTEFALDLDFAKLAQASGCYGERVTEPAEIENALKRAIDANEGGRPAVLDFFVAKERLKGSVEFFKR